MHLSRLINLNFNHSNRKMNLIPFEFCVGNFENYLKKSISTFIEQFTSNVNNLKLNRNPKIITDFNCKLSSDLDDLKFFFSGDEGINVYIGSVENNLTDLLNILNITKKSLTYNIQLKEEAKSDIDHLVFSVLGARFNNEVEIDPIILLISKYENKIPSNLSDPTV